MGRQFNSRNVSTLVSACSVATLWLASGMPAHAAEGAVGTIMEEVQVTARKRAEAERLQEVPVAATAYSGDQLEALQTKDLQDLSFKMPNVQLDDVGTVKNTANFTVRGLGVNSSIPSIDPTVGVFVDGMYMGVNAGVVTDMFDLEGIEVLRGPQGLLFGRNVTGGAVVIRTARPTEEFSSRFKLSTTDNLDTVAAGTVNGAISDSVNGRFTAYYNDDQGWFENVYTGNDSAGASDTFFIRPSVSVQLSETADLLVRMEHGKMDSDGVVAQNRGNEFVWVPTNDGLIPGYTAPQIAAAFGVTDWDNSSDSFEVAQNEEGFQEDEWTHVITEFNQDVAFGNGTITNILAWREYGAVGLGDIDSLPITAFHANTRVDQSQLSNELRYAGRFGPTSLTTGVYWFSQELEYFENRLLPLNGLDITGGGLQDHEALGVFAQADIDLNESWILTLGGRYSREEKDAEIATINPVVASNTLCDLDGCAAYDFSDSESWNAFTPKVGLQWQVSDDAQLYSYWTKGFRSGGYNMRNTGLLYQPGPTDQEEQTSFELGGKAEWLDGRVRTNLALFHNTIDDMQREENLPDPVFSVVQYIRNTADATIQGAEFEAMAAASDTLLFTFNVGYVDGDYDSVRGDISGDGVVNDVDLGLDIPRLAPWTYGVGLVHDLELGSAGAVTSRINFNHRDASPYTDNNRGMLSEADMLDFSIGYSPDAGSYRVTLFGRNMLDEVTEGNNTQLPPTLGGLGASFTPLNKGRVMGVELTYDL
ncbi:TonB-dependent receptor [Microbulbifer yueqingensis]|uniref:Iron complex outermembrane recepter protein n=1 Tax=Microbulbifer yueqingensis TaxID=658219 RepID=A0A1G8V1H2_9GAMM|nr:TonB-dependent receptor [Microbulbifer yueqingensis]SDJ59020.1 iron complex outermembrane recepter protein [Microbulbifer yueqingensis]